MWLEISEIYLRDPYCSWPALHNYAAGAEDAFGVEVLRSMPNVPRVHLLLRHIPVTEFLTHFLIFIFANMQHVVNTAQGVELS